MNTILKTTEKILLMMAFSMLSFSGVSAYEGGPIGYDSDIYKYNALKNEASFHIMVKSTDNKEEASFQNVESPDNVMEELEDITRKQNVSVEEINIAIKELEDRNVIRSFLTGNNLGTLKFQLVQITDQIDTLEALSLKTNDSEIKARIDSQTKSLKEEKIKVESYILKQGNKFNLFGWLVTSF